MLRSLQTKVQLAAEKRLVQAARRVKSDKGEDPDGEKNGEERGESEDDVLVDSSAVCSGEAAVQEKDARTIGKHSHAPAMFAIEMVHLCNLSRSLLTRDLPVFTVELLHCQNSVYIVLQVIICYFGTAQFCFCFFLNLGAP